MSELVLVKLGGSLITDKATPYALQAEVLDRLCAEISAARAARELALVVGNGAGSFAHVSASRHRTHEGITDAAGWRGFCEVHHDALRLSTHVREALTRAGELAVTLPPSAACVMRGGRIVRYRTGPVERLVRGGVIPLVYGDVCVDEAQGCAIASTEEVLGYLAGALRPARLLLVGKVEGVLDADGALIRSITPDSLAAIRGVLRASDGIADVTGGMLQKVTAALASGVRTEIINGLVPDRLCRALLGEQVPGTVVDPGRCDAQST